MWRASIRAIAECIHFVMRCTAPNNLDIDDLNDIPDYDIQDVPVYLQQQSFDLSVPTRQQQDDMHHRPDAPCIRRRSPPEVVTKILQAIDEMNETKSTYVVDANNDKKFKFDDSASDYGGR